MGTVLRSNKVGHSLLSNGYQVPHEKSRSGNRKRKGEAKTGIAKRKRKSFMEWDYWGKPVPGYGDPSSKLMILGLAPAAHGGNRTGRVFTGDKSADFLFRCLWLAFCSNF